MDNFILILDYYDIQIENAIGALTGQQIAEFCVDLPSTDNQFCDAIQRVPQADGGEISGFTSGNINFSELRARGLDFDVRYGFDVPSSTKDLGSIQLNLTGTRFLEQTTESDPIIGEIIASETDPLQQELLTIDQGFNSDNLDVIGIPELVWNLGVNWEYKDLRVGASGRFEGSTSRFSNADQNTVEIVNGAVVVSDNEGLVDPSQLNTGSSFEIDLNASYDVSESFNIYGGVSNLTDKEPFAGSLFRPVGPRGRFFFAGVRGTF